MNEQNRPRLTSVTFGRSGGIAGITLAATVPAAELDDSQLAVLADLIDPSTPEASSVADDAGADRFSYHLKVRAGRRTHRFDWPEGAVPPQVQPLLAELNRRATPQ